MFDPAYFDGVYFEFVMAPIGPPLGPAGADCDPYFDRTYFDSTYFCTDPASVSGGRHALRRIPVLEDPDELFALI